MEKIDIDVDVTDAEQVELVFLGDYIDRGEESAAVVMFLHELTMAHDLKIGVTCLAGNHEKMLLSFLDDPVGRSRRWLKHGGLQTLESFGIGPPSSVEKPSMCELIDIAGYLRDAIGSSLITWLNTLPASWNSGNLWATHAGADPTTPMKSQIEETLIWGHEDFFRGERLDGQWVVVGHKPVAAPFIDRGRIAIDTGAVYGGRLTALKSAPDKPPVFLQS